MPLIFAMLGLVVLVIALVTVVGALGFIAANFALIGVALLGGLAISMAFGGVSTSTTVIATVALLLVLLSNKRRRVPARRKNYDLDLAAEAVPAKPLPAEAVAPPTPLDLAWAAAAENADWARSRLAVAQESCRLFLGVADRLPMDVEAGALAVRIRKRIPEHVNECLDKCQLVTASERRAILDELIFTLEKVGASADRHRARLMGPVTGEMHVQRQHLTREADPGPIALD